MKSDWQIAQLNVAIPRRPLESPALAEFVAALAPVNAVADSAPGFVWRLADESGDATSIRAFGDDRLIVNMSVWESVEALWEFVYSGRHLAVMRRRREWMTKIAASHLVLWWVRAGEIPTVEDAGARLDLLRAEGPTAAAFTFKQRYPVPGAPEAEPARDDREPCAAR